MKGLRIFLVGFSVLGAVLLSMNFSAHAAAVESINLEEYLKNKLKKHEDKISKDLFGEKGYKIKEVKFKGSLDTNFTLLDQELPMDPVLSAEQYGINCAEEGDIGKTFKFANKEEESFEVTNSKTIDVGASITVSASIPFTSAGMESSFDFNVETGQSETKGSFETHEWEDVSTYSVAPRHHATGQFIIFKSRAKKVPYSGYIKVFGPVEVTMQGVAGKGSGSVELYKDAHYSGNMNYFHSGDNVSLSKERKKGNPSNDAISSIKIKGPLEITVYEHVHYKGKHKTFKKSTAYVGDKFNDMISSFRVGGITVLKSKTIQLDKYLSSEELKIAISGTLKAAQGMQSMVKVKSKKITDVKADCDEDAPALTHSALKNTKIMTDGKIISTKIRPGVKKK
ncbi:MAG: hypothetical protein K8S27_05225 [Candidatus Omnitrophica bacterium]|nr:hypothetical protein [Candidatus Omnitrophota bacterium]